MIGEGVKDYRYVLDCIKLILLTWCKGEGSIYTSRFYFFVAYKVDL